MIRRVLLWVGFLVGVVVCVSANAERYTTVILYQQNLPSSYVSVTEALAQRYPEAKQIAFTSYVSEVSSQLQEIRPLRVVVVVQPEKVTPDFVDNADSTFSQIVPGDFQDVVWTVVTGVDAAAAAALVTASDASGGKALLIGNPDGSLYPESGEVPHYLASFLSNTGNSSTYINLTDQEDPDIVASSVAAEINGNPVDCIFYDGHGEPYGWLFRVDDLLSGSGGELAGVPSSGGSIAVNNGKPAFIFSTACLTARIHGNRASPWYPWEDSSVNEGASWGDSIALAWLKDSPGVYVGSDSVQYSDPMTKTVFHLVADGMSPAEAVRWGKNALVLLEGETRDTDPSDGTAADLLAYSAREVLTVGDPSWKVPLAGGSPGYSVQCTIGEQQDQLPTVSRGYVYVDQDVKFACSVTVSVTKQMFVEASSTGENYYNTEMTPYFVENVGALFGMIWAEGEGVCISGAVKPTEDTTMGEFAGEDPSDADKLYSYPSTPVFKCKGVSGGFVWLIGAGVTDDDGDGWMGYTIPSGYSKQFDGYFYVPGVSQKIVSTQETSSSGTKEVELINISSRDIADVIARVPLPWGAENVQVSGDAEQVTLVSDADGVFAEFTVASIASGETKSFTVSYDITSSGGGSDSGGNGGGDTGSGGGGESGGGSGGVVADAGEDMNVHAGDTVQLDGSGSTGQSLSYQWSQLSGIEVSLQNADSAVASFVAPSNSTDYSLVFRLTVTDAEGNTSSDTVTVNVYVSDTVPKVTKVTILNIHGTITTPLVDIGFYLEEPDKDRCSVRVEYTGGSAGDAWKAATVVGYTGNLEPGKMHAVTWQCGIDEAGVEADDYRVRVIPTDGKHEGTSVESTRFALSNVDRTLSPTGGGSSSGGGGCFLATAAFGSGMELCRLRNVRDAYLLTASAGSRFVFTYYGISPEAAGVERCSGAVRALVRRITRSSM